MKILVVDDDASLRKFLETGLRSQNCSVDLASTAVEALEFVAVAPYDVVVLDLNLPDSDGASVLRAIHRHKSNAAVLVLSARGQVEDRVSLLQAGADDYMTKPFAFDELLARVQALHRRKEGARAELRVGNLELDHGKRCVKVGAKNIDLTSKEFALLDYLVRNVDRVVTRTMLLEHVWDLHFDVMSNVVEVYMAYLRRKLPPDAGIEIVTKRGTGYMLRAADKRKAAAMNK